MEDLVQAKSGGGLRRKGLKTKFSTRIRPAGVHLSSRGEGGGSGDELAVGISDSDSDRFRDSPEHKSTREYKTQLSSDPTLRSDAVIVSTDPPELRLPAVERN